MKKIFDKISSPGESPIKSALKLGHFLLTKPGLTFLLRKAKNAINKLGLRKEHEVSFDEWLKNQENDIIPGSFKGHPLISILIYNVSSSGVAGPLMNIARQTYTNWELLITCNSSKEKDISNSIAGLYDGPNRIELVITDSEDLPDAVSTLAKHAKGMFLFFHPEDAVIRPNALAKFARHIDQHPSDEIVYSDSLTIANKELVPYFKPGWSPDALMSRNYIGNSFFIKSLLYQQLGGINTSLGRACLYDLLLRAAEETAHIGHITNILLATDGAGSFINEDKKAIEAALKRRNTPGEVIADPAAEGVFFIDYTITKSGKVSIIIPTKDNVPMLRTTIESIIELTHYKNYEIILLNNNSTTKEFFDLVKEYTDNYASFFKCVDASFPFNFSKLINLGVAASSGEYILMLNNDVEVLQADWLERMMGYSQLPHIGAVGVKLLFPDETIQHAGVVLGIGDGASHSFINFPKESDIYYNYLRAVNNCSAVTAACLMVRRDVYDEVGGMDEALPVEFNDVDFCLKLRKAGYYNVYIPSVELYHYESATRGHPFRSHTAWKQHEHDMNYFKNKWGSLIDNDPFYNPNLTKEYTDFRQKRRTKA